MFGALAWTPGSVEACRAGAWSVLLTSRKTGELVAVPFRCRSWRCPRCRRAVAARDVERIEKALGGRRLEDLVFVTLTFDQERIRSAVRLARPWLDAGEVEREARGLAWASVGRCWKRLRDSLVHRYRTTDLVPSMARKPRRPLVVKRRKARLDYVLAHEAHRSGWPHVHAVLYLRELAADVRSRGFYERRSEPGRPWSRWRDRVLEPLAVAAGFGWRCDAELPRRDAGALAGYLGKLAKELGRADVKEQDPTPAPRGFRRIRATPEFLEPFRARALDPEFEGEIMLAPPEHVAGALAAGALESLDVLRTAWNLAARPVRELIARSHELAEHVLERGFTDPEHVPRVHAAPS